MSNTLTLGELLVSVGGSIKTGPFGTTLKASEYTDTGTPVISVGEVGYGNIQLHERTPRVDDGVTSRLPEYVLRAGDIVFGRKGAVDRSAWVKPSEDGYFLGSDGIRVRVGAAASSRFIAYQLQSADVREWLTRHASGTTMLSLNQKTLERVELRVPPLSDQRAIAEVLGALDDKIAANNRIGTITKDLLVAKFAQLGMDEFDREESRVSPINSLFHLNPSERLQMSEHDPVYLEMKNLPADQMTVSQWDRRAAKGGARFRNGDTLLARITPCLENGKVGYVDFLADGDVGVGSTEFIVMRSRAGIPQSLPYFMAISSRFREFAIRHMVGTTGRQRLAAADVGLYEVAVPDQEDLDKFEVLAQPLMRRVKAAVDESRVLEKTRDELLPLLMSGKLRVKDAEKKVEAIV
ncbi:restriction endonuclease subunit S [Nocardia sp. No.11]|uniref:restriction endonuclease subunit S n=1 Tax=Nocardia sp. No.11 TaxID=3128861 RepID=UPI00319E87B7